MENHLPTSQSPLLELIGISKRFPGTIANDQISFQVMPGEIHALLGENGAGKSTLMNIIYGVLRPDAGSILWRNKEVEIRDPQTARKLGIGMVFQHFSLLETLTVRENLRLSMPESASALIDAKLLRLAEDHGLEIDPDALVASLSTGQKQRVEIARCLLQNVKLLILDEPTSVLTPNEAEDLLQILKKLASEGCSILFISHKLVEIRSLCDKATVLRSGKVVGSCIPQDKSTEQITEMMLGSGTEIDQEFAEGALGKTVLKLTRVSSTPRSQERKTLFDLDFELHAGEILGLAGVAGNGQDELVNLINGELRATRGELFLEEQNITHYSVRKRRQLGIATLPVERLSRCAAPALSLKENFLLTNYLSEPEEPSTGKWFVSWSKIAEKADQVIARYGVKTLSINSAASSLSGGNLQKFLIGREVDKNPRLLVCYNPTWGVDVGAANLIHKALIALRDEGAAILVISEDIDELFTISDRMGAVCAGRLSPIKQKNAVDLPLLGQWMTGEFGSPDNKESAA